MTARPAAPLGVLLLVLAACTAGAGDLGTVAPPPGSDQPSLPIPSPEGTPGPTEVPGSPAPSGSPSATPTASAATTTIRVYFMLGSFTGDSGLVPVLRTIPKTQAVGAAAMQALLAGPRDAELAARPAMYTAVPDGVEFIGLEIRDGIASVNLTTEFDAGGTSATLPQRYAQVVYTLTQFPTITGVQFKIDGQQSPAVVTGGTVDPAAPVDRSSYEDQLPAIWVDRPAWGGALPSGSAVSGTADVFEAQFRLMILDGSGRALTDMPVKATCGTGCRGDFAANVAYHVTRAQWGTLRVFEPSAKDGSPLHVVDYPVWLTP